MSPHTANSLMSDLVAMAKAMEDLPKVLAELDQANGQIEAYAKQLQSREISIIDLKQQVETANSMIRSLEVARDDAELRFLELEDKTTHIIGRTRDAQALMGQVILVLDPPKPEPVSTIQDQLAKEGHGIEPGGHGSSSDQGSSADPLSETTHQVEHSWATSGGETTGEALVQRTEESMSDPSPGQSEADPTVTGTASPSTDAPNTFAHSTDAVTTAGKYSNKLYEDHPYYVSLAAWIAGGGTEADYNYRRPSMVGSISGDQH